MILCISQAFFSQFGSKLKDIKTQAFQKLNKKLSKLKDFVISKLNFSEKLRSLDARNEFLCSKKQINLGRNSTKLKKKLKNSRKLWHQNSRKLPKLKFSENPLTYFARQTAKKKPALDCRACLLVCDCDSASDRESMVIDVEPLLCEIRLEMR